MANYKGKKTLEVLEGADNYNKWIAERIRPFLKSPVLEVGAGTGNISEKLLELKDLTLTDSNTSFVKILNKKFSNNKNVNVEVFDASKKISKVKYKFKSVYAVNVLEHIKDDIKALQNINSLLEKKGKIVLLVPAKKNAYSYIDKKLGHYRRYEKEELVEKLKQSNFKNIKIEFFNVVGLLSWYLRDKIDSKNSHLKPSHVKAFDWLVPLLMMLEPRKGLPVGISLVAVATKK